MDILADNLLKLKRERNAVIVAIPIREMSTEMADLVGLFCIKQICAHSEFDVLYSRSSYYAESAKIHAPDL